MSDTQYPLPGDAALTPPTRAGSDKNSPAAPLWWPTQPDPTRDTPHTTPRTDAPDALPTAADARATASQQHPLRMLQLLPQPFLQTARLILNRRVLPHRQQPQMIRSPTILIRTQPLLNPMIHRHPLRYRPVHQCPGHPMHPHPLRITVPLHPYTDPPVPILRCRQHPAPTLSHLRRIAHDPIHQIPISRSLSHFARLGF